MKIIDRYFEILGHSIHFRFEPKEFRRDRERVNQMIRVEDFRSAQDEIDRLIEKWGQDQEILNLGKILRFEKFKAKNLGTQG